MHLRVKSSDILQAFETLCLWWMFTDCDRGKSNIETEIPYMLNCRDRLDLQCYVHLWPDWIEIQSDEGLLKLLLFLLLGSLVHSWKRQFVIYKFCVYMYQSLRHTFLRHSVCQSIRVFVRMCVSKRQLPSSLEQKMSINSPTKADNAFDGKSAYPLGSIYE